MRLKRRATFAVHVEKPPNRRGSQTGRVIPSFEANDQSSAIIRSVQRDMDALRAAVETPERRAFVQADMAEIELRTAAHFHDQSILDRVVSLLSEDINRGIIEQIMGSPAVSNTGQPGSTTVAFDLEARTFSTSAEDPPVG